jgi:hypothetical protein
MMYRWPRGYHPNRWTGAGQFGIARMFMRPVAAAGGFGPAAVVMHASVYGRFLAGSPRQPTERALLGGEASRIIDAEFREIPHTPRPFARLRHTLRQVWRKVWPFGRS